MDVFLQLTFMIKKYHPRPIFYLIFSLCLLAQTPNTFASTPSNIDWPVYKGDTNAYYSNRLATPVAVYVYDQSQALVGIIETGGMYTQDSMSKVAQTLAQKSFRAQSKQNLALTGAALSIYLADQGYGIGDLVSKDEPFTLLFVDWDIQSAECGWMIKAITDYKRSIENVVAQQGDRNIYATRELRLSSKQVSISCKK